MNKLKQISLFLAVTLIATVIAGCVDNGDVYKTNRNKDED